MRNLGLAIALSCLACVASAQTGDPLKAAQAALAGGQPARALEILQPLEASRAGDIHYDYLLGLARLDSGDPERAIFALERVLALQPTHAQARAEIGRAYLQLGERDAGVKELKSVRSAGVPDDARRTIDNYLNAFGAGPTRLSGYLDATVGYDSNINSAVSSSRVVIPLLGMEAIISPDGRRREDSFFALGGGIGFMHPLAQHWSVLGGAAFTQRWNSEHARFDTRNLEGNIGIRYASGANALTLGLQGQTFDVNESRNRDAPGLVGQWQHQLDATTQFTAYGQYVQLRYPGQNLRNADRSIAGIAVAKVLPGAWTPSLFASLYAGEERETKSGVPHLGHTPWGIRFGGQIKPSATITWFANASFENRRYGGRDPLFLVRREDQQWDIRLGMNYEPARYWIVSPQISHTRNDSNTAINDYSRTMVTLTVRREF